MISHTPFARLARRFAHSHRERASPLNEVDLVRDEKAEACRH